MSSYKSFFLSAQRPNNVCNNRDRKKSLNQKFLSSKLLLLHLLQKKRHFLWHKMKRNHFLSKNHVLLYCTILVSSNRLLLLNRSHFEKNFISFNLEKFNIFTFLLAKETVYFFKQKNLLNLKAYLFSSKFCFISI